MTINPYLPLEAEVIERIQETPTIVTLRLRLTDPDARHRFYCSPGQFNMLYLYGVGEVPISIKSGPQSFLDQTLLLDHTIRAVGRVTRALVELQPGARLGVRGPYGRGWPLKEAQGKDVHVITGGLGCAPAVSMVHELVKQRGRFGRISVVQGVKHADDLIWREQYEHWAKQPDTQVLLAADQPDATWRWHQGMVTGLLDQLTLNPDRSIAMLCGPEPMMRASAERLIELGLEPEQIWLSMERNMQCAIGHCGHCQFGGAFVCKDGPVFNYPQVRELLGVRGF
ncbi:FAD/NAD(P)-binding protein [Marinobacterium litorale]|uniref:FAD/NAD(P)-binding protein n=1 Tax=Marinobacterium litorale TaxID=404770 RepID=UPI0004014FB8|nr:FAD/NAD(P)-binding protein [Marinobacterium litorale]